MMRGTMMIAKLVSMIILVALVWVAYTIGTEGGVDKYVKVDGKEVKAFAQRRVVDVKQASNEAASILPSEQAVKDTVADVRNKTAEAIKDK
jgi:hypothetical protein